MVIGRRKQAERVAEEGGPVRPGVKGGNFCRDEEEQLCRSVLHVTQDCIVGNQQRVGVFWKRITIHYKENQPQGPRPQRSLETKWGTIKHDVSKFIGVYSQVVRLNRSGSSVGDTMRRAHELYRTKNNKGLDFQFEHCWLLLKDHPKWAEGWIHVKPPTPKRKAPPTTEDQDCSKFVDMEQGAGVVSQGGGGSVEGTTAVAARMYQGRPGGTKQAKEDQQFSKTRESLMFALAEATKNMAAAHKRKCSLLEDQNLLMLKSMPDADVVEREYLRLRKHEEL
ncbi:hypothetical protein KC19_VG137000 [Ceratodon purpureus]|uniref:No apical meristem-associated C-terminal domain-containing protein n=1 Tax=Ceratodon purpureus TaxID=3225 RepID=A0A8T0HPS2_CERPU|nr:hypothetical protein KC19_VG137000 [Ceratodon purpureus]